jgi:hypothetical protein
MRGFSGLNRKRCHHEVHEEHEVIKITTWDTDEHGYSKILWRSLTIFSSPSRSFLQALHVLHGKKPVFSHR